MKQPESLLVTKLIKKLNEIPGCCAQKMHGSPFGAPMVDILGCLRGRMFLIEVKTPGNKPTVRQMATLAKWATAGALTGWATCWEEVEHILKQEDK